MSIVFESGHRSSFLADESYPNIDQAGEEVERYDEADGGNDVSDVMHDVGDLGVAVTVGYHPPDQAILADSEPSRALDVVGRVGGVDGVVDDDVQGADPHGLPGPSDMNSAAAAAVASIAAAEAEVARVAAEAAAAQRSLSVAQALQQPASLAPSPPDSMKASSPPTSGLAMPAPSQRVKPIPKPDRDIQKNGQGVYQCTWPNCSEDGAKTFARKCEYNKHMDKHERPYRCVVDGCQKLPGFTYSGGLLRHEREVHGKHGGPRNPLHCPHQNCKRHAGKGFSRAENLNEHLRRVHTSISPGPSPGSDAPIMSSILSGHVTTTTTGAASGIASTVTSAAAADALLAQVNSGLLSLSSLGGLSSVLRSLPVLPSSPPPSGEVGVVDDLGPVNGDSSGSGSNSNNNNGNGNGNGGSSTSSAATAAAAAAAAAAATAAASAVAERFSSPTLLTGLPGTDVDSDNAKAMEDSLNLLLHASPSAATQAADDPATPRGRKRTAAAMMAEDGDGDGDGGLGDAILTGGDYHGQHHDLREEMKRLRQENQEQRLQLDVQKRHTIALMHQIAALRQLMAAQHQEQLQAAQHKQHKQQGMAGNVLGSPTSPTSPSLQDPSDILSG